jgi:MFS family permease
VSESFRLRAWRSGSLQAIQPQWALETGLGLALLASCLVLALTSGFNPLFAVVAALIAALVGLVAAAPAYQGFLRRRAEKLQMLPELATANATGALVFGAVSGFLIAFVERGWQMWTGWRSAPYYALALGALYLGIGLGRFAEQRRSGIVVGFQWRHPFKGVRGRLEAEMAEDGAPA